MKRHAVATRISRPSPDGSPDEVAARPRLSQGFEAVAGVKKSLVTAPVREPVRQSEEVKRWKREMVRLAYNLSKRKR
jgi:hypothetical protein